MAMIGFSNEGNLKKRPMKKEDNRRTSRNEMVIVISGLNDEKYRT